jgi:hypothetical protein
VIRHIKNDEVSTLIKVFTKIEIHAPIEVCFDLARNIDVHTETVSKHTRERAIKGIIRVQE